jgi:reactive chlorine resistance protein C
MTLTQIRSTEQSTLDAVGGLMARYGLAIVLVWYGGLKFMDYEAQGIAPLVSESPFMSWLYNIFSVSAFSALLGVFEITAAVLLAAKPWWPKASIFGSLLAMALFVATISFMFTTPGVFEASQGGFPALSLAGGFLMKDIALLGISAWTLADALRATRSSLAGSSQAHATSR